MYTHTHMCVYICICVYIYIYIYMTYDNISVLAQASSAHSPAEAGTPDDQFRNHASSAESHRNDQLTKFLGLGGRGLVFHRWFLICAISGGGCTLTPSDFHCSLVFSEGLSLVQWIVTGMFQMDFHRQFPVDFICVRSGV